MIIYVYVCERNIPCKIFQVKYYFKLKFDSHGDIMATHCECVAVKRPHGTCKHIAAVFMMLQHFKESGELLVGRSCTENLQSFHRPKSAMNSSPTKEFAFVRPFRTESGDPRPLQRRNEPGFADRARNHVLNYCAHTQKDITMRFLYRKADIQASAADHNYTKLPITEHWVDSAVSVSYCNYCLFPYTYCRNLSYELLDWVSSS